MRKKKEEARKKEMINMDGENFTSINSSVNINDSIYNWKSINDKND